MKPLLDKKEQRNVKNIIQSYKHNIYSESISKISIPIDDDRRHILKNNIDTLVLGHYLIKDL